MAADTEKATVLLQFMTNDPAGEERPDGTLLQRWHHRTAEPMLDGPVTSRLAVIDFDPQTGKVLPGARLLPPRSPGNRSGVFAYAIADPGDPDSEGFRAVSVFSAVLRMMSIFEEADVLGRPLGWAFRGQQLLIVPRAGLMANAFYHRDSRSLQFFSFPAGTGSDTPLAHTCLSPDIVAHEATHAILDGIAPDLYDAASPQALALHEAIADLGAVVFAARTDRLRRKVLERTGGDLRRTTAFNEIAQQLGGAGGEKRPLRNLFNDFSLARGGRPPPSGTPHGLSNVLSGALYAFLLHAFRREQAKAMGLPKWDFDAGRDDEALREAQFSTSGKSLVTAADIFKRVAFRALDYLPPGEVAFADYARALIAADTASNPTNAWARDFLKREFVRRGIVADSAELDPAAPEIDLPADLDLDQLIRSDWAAYQFVEARRAALMIPERVPFEVRPRLDVTKTTFRGVTGPATVRECLLKVAWREPRLVALGRDDLSEVSLVFGTTLVIDRQSHRAHTLLSTSRAHTSQSGEATRVNDAMRVTFLKACLAEGLLDPGSSYVQFQGGQFRLRAMARMLHMAGG